MKISTRLTGLLTAVTLLSPLAMAEMNRTQGTIAFRAAALAA